MDRHHIVENCDHGRTGETVAQLVGGSEGVLLEISSQIHLPSILSRFQAHREQLEADKSIHALVIDLGTII